MKQPVDHILRPSLPWRVGPGMTECGLDASEISTLTREQYFARRRDLGQQRCAMFTCMTCSNTAHNWKTWEDDPRSAIGREVEWESRWGRSDRGDRLRDELVAIAALIEAHPEEFAEHVARLNQRREWLAKKAAHQASSERGK